MAMPSSATARPQNKPTTIHGGQVFLECMVQMGVDTIFGLPGGSILPIYDSLPNYPIRHILVRHEQGATHMAEGYARATGKPGVVLVTSGPGATNIITGLTDAYYDSVPMVVFTGNVATQFQGNDSFQEADITGMTRPCTKHNISVRTVQDLPSAIAEAFYVATSGRPGPVLVDMPKDVVYGLLEYDYQPATFDLPGYQPHVDTFTEETLDEALALIQAAERPVMISGGGVILGNAHQQVYEFAKRFQIPTACSLMGLSGFPTSDPLFLGFCGMHGQFSANLAIANADVLLVVGGRLNERQTGKPDRFAKNARIIHIDMDPLTLDRNVQSFLPIQGDLVNVFDRLLDKTQSMEPNVASRSQWFDTIAEWKGRRKERPEPVGFITPHYAIERLFKWMPADGFVTTEVGQHQMWAAQSFNLDRARSFISSGGFGTMGFGFPAALGIKAACPEAMVLDIAGDGSFQMTLQELATAKDFNLPVKVAIINNGHLGMVRQWQGKMYGKEEQVQMTSPNYIKLAEAYGCKGFIVEDPAQLDAVIQEAFAIQDCPVIIDIHVNERTDVYPWVPAGASNDEMLTEENQHKE